MFMVKTESHRLQAGVRYMQFGMKGGEKGQLGRKEHQASV